METIAGKIKSSLFDLLPIILVVLFFDIMVLQQPFSNLLEILQGLVFVVVGIMLFVEDNGEHAGIIDYPHTKNGENRG